MADEGNQATGDAWGDDISEERKAMLEAELQAWEQEVDHKGRKGPFDAGREPIIGGPLNRERLTGADVFWLAARSVAGSGNETAIVTAKAQIRPNLLVHRPVPAVPELHLERANLLDAHLERSHLSEAHLEEAYLQLAHLEESYLGAAHLEGADLTQAHLESYLSEAHLEAANLSEAHLERANLRAAHLEGAYLQLAHLEKADLQEAHLEGANLSWAKLEGVHLHLAHLEGAVLQEAHLEGANLWAAHLEGRRFAEDDEDLQRILRWAKYFGPTKLSPADLRGAFFDRATQLKDATFGNSELGNVRVADTQWGEVNLAVVNWGDTPILYDERAAKEWKPYQPKDTSRRLTRQQRREAQQRQHVEQLNRYRDAVRANRQLATVLRTQGLNDDADKFAYRAQVLQRRVLRLQGRRGAATFSWLLDLISGYGYEPVRSVIAYVVIILVFAGLYLINGQFAAPHLRPDEALVLSISSFHGRGFFTSDIHLGDNLARLAAGEAIVGLLIEITFIATFTQRFFAR
jgi:uncharacterized protein YjbI with pentapeptide repeats